MIHLTDLPPESQKRKTFFFFFLDLPLIGRAVSAETARVDQCGQSGAGDVGDG